MRAGFNHTGSQRLRCQRCKRYFTPQRKPMGYNQATRELAVRLYLEGNSFRGIGKVLNVHYMSVINWVNAHERTLPQEVADKTPADTVETDELFTYIAQKKSGST
ncbi:MAG TPA: hypothetical protein VJ183_05205 [Chloroflexia bacterium]|nr:hypothetical protein [Chloroflexia bacterium]